MTSKITIVQDDREKTPWNFKFYGYGQEVIRLKTGDYTIGGLENWLVIERKKSPSELATNFGQKWEQFERLLDKMLDYRFRYILCEFTIMDLKRFPAGLPPYLQRRIYMKGDKLLNRIHHELGRRNIPIEFYANAHEAERRAATIFEEVFNVFKRESKS